MKFIRKNNVVEAYRVNPENARGLAAWCGGLFTQDTKQANTNPPTEWREPGVHLIAQGIKAALGQWIIKDGDLVFVMDNEVFNDLFQEVDEDTEKPVRNPNINAGPPLLDNGGVDVPLPLGDEAGAADISGAGADSGLPAQVPRGGDSH